VPSADVDMVKSKEDADKLEKELEAMLEQKEDLEIREILRTADLAEKTGPEAALDHLTT
jgi:hypothetical protein